MKNQTLAQIKYLLEENLYKETPKRKIYHFENDYGVLVRQLSGRYEGFKEIRAIRFDYVTNEWKDSDIMLTFGCVDNEFMKAYAADVADYPDF